jgi:hypothetical protein
MSRPCTVCTNPRRAEIDGALVAGETFHQVSVRFGIPKANVFRHRAHVANRLALARQRSIADQARLQAEDGALLAQDEQRRAAAIAIDVDVVGELQRSVKRMIRLCEACDRWLADPEDPVRYDLSPRAEEIMVTYSEDTGPRKRATLADLLARLGGAVRRDRVEMEAADPRRLLVMASTRMQAQLQLLAQLDGQLDSLTPEVDALNDPQWIAIRAAIFEALEAFPDARLAVANRLRLLEAEQLVQEDQP